MHRILLLEPDKLLADNVASTLRGRGHEVDWQVDPQAALESADTKLPDAIILDLLLAGRGGVEFLYEFRSYGDWQAVPVIIFSGLSAEELLDNVDGLSHLNITAYHYKPATTLAQLCLSVEAALQKAAA